MPPKRTRKLSTTELTILGIAWLRGPCTIYTLMKVLSQTGSTYHSSRAGTTYSVANRLIKFSLLSHLDSESEGGERLVQVTEQGEKVLREWYQPPIALQDVAYSSDLIRLRFYFMGVCSREERLAFVDNSREGLMTFLDKCRGLLRKNEELGDVFGVLASLSAIKETEARIEWLDIVRKWVDDPSSLPKPWSESVLKAQ